LLKQARAAVARDDFGGALGPIAEHTRRFRDGRLVEEREALRVKALAGLGRGSEASRAATSFEARFPKSVLLPTVRRISSTALRIPAATVTVSDPNCLMIRALTSTRLNLLLAAAPISWALAVAAPASSWIFIAAAVSLIPLAGIIGLATEELARRSGPAWGGFLNATFGNAAEMIIAVVALHQGHLELVQASITGSIVGNLLLVLGLSFFAGGLGRLSQKFHRTTANNSTSMLFSGGCSSGAG